MYYHNPAIEAEIKRRAREGRIIITDHARDREESRDIQDVEVFRCLRTGVLHGEDWNAEYQETTYRMALRESQTSTLITIVALSDQHNIAVTVFRKIRK